MDFESEKLIQNMLAQDAAEQVLFNPLLTPSVTPSKRWSKEEIDCLKSALKIYGNQYSKISSIVFQGSRTSLQVKNRVQHMSYYGQLDDDQKTIVKQVKPVLKPVVKTKFKTPISTNADTISAVIPPVIISDDDVDIDEPIIKETSASIPITYNNLESDSDSSSEPESKNTIESFDLNNNIQINRDSIQQFEMSGNPEFFNPKGRVNKSADRYKLIRNHILDLWEIHRPKFVNKTLSRKGLIGHGDVNSISNIWNFLNNVGAINIGVVKKVKQVKVKRERKEKLDELDLGISVLPHKMLHIPFSKRVRKVKGDDGEWFFYLILG